MLKITRHGVILNKTTLVFENEGVLNPAVIKEGNSIHMFYRAVSKGNYSSIGYCKLSDPFTIEERHTTPLLFPQHKNEIHGVEDPRITKIEDVYYLTYTAYDGVNALGALATSTDLQNFEKHGIIVPQFTFDEFRHLAGCKDVINEKYDRFNNRNLPIHGKAEKKILVWDKNLIFFPRRIDGKLFFLHRIRPDIQITAVGSLDELTKDFWEKYFLHFELNISLTSKYKHEVSYIGGGCPPIETEHGWLLIYHGVHDTTSGYVYSACVALLDIDNPCKEITRLTYPLFEPNEDWEILGEVNNVCFPTGTVLIDDTLYIYYGAADERIACASVSLSALLSELLLTAEKNN